MRIKQYGITLRRVEKRDIELIRKIRNSKRIKNKMIYREHITKDMQFKWFKSIEREKTQAYYIVLSKNNKIGLIHINKIHNKNEFNSGIFLFNDKYENSYIPVLASIILIKVELYIVKDNNYSYIKVLKSNNKALNYNKSLGYFIEDETDIYYKMKITKDSYEKTTIKLFKAIKSLYGDSKLEFIFEEIDFKLGLFEQYRHYIKLLDKIIIKKIEKENYKKFILDI